MRTCSGRFAVEVMGFDPGLESTDGRAGDTLDRRRRRALAARTESLRDHGDQVCRESTLRRPRQLALAIGPVDGERVVVAVEGEPLAHLVRGDHVELLAFELL